MFFFQRRRRKNAKLNRAMFYFFLNKNFRWVTLLLAVFGVFLFFIDRFAEQLISVILGNKFYYSEEAFLKLVFLLIGVVTIGLLLGLHKNPIADDETKQKTASYYALSLIISTLCGFGVHVFFVVNEMNNAGTLYELEENVFIYYLPNFFLVGGFIIGGWRIRSLEIVKIKKEK
jgi:hypothetical protein